MSVWRSAAGKGPANAPRVENMPENNVNLSPIVVDCTSRNLDDLLGREWLVTNSLGSYASSTPLGCNTRRYHGLLVASTTPPVGRIMTLSCLVEQITLNGETYDLSTHEFFGGTIAPKGYLNLKEFRNEAAATFIYRLGKAELTKRVLLADRANVVAVQYTLRHFEGSASLTLRPLLAMRDFHHLQKRTPNNRINFEQVKKGVVVHDLDGTGQSLFLHAEGTFQADPQWWYNFHYRVDHGRGQDSQEDLYSPGVFNLELQAKKPIQLTASLGEPEILHVEDSLRRRQARQTDLADSLGDKASPIARQLAIASDAFVVQRSFPSSAAGKTILAGYPWFADWGRDTFIALPGLLLCTRRFADAQKVFSTFADHISEGMLPNRFDDYSTAAHYNSIDASLWFILAAERYLQATDDQDFWKNTLMPASDSILKAYQKGTRFDIHADADGLLMGGNAQTQLTWMDAKLGNEAITPRHGKAVEINALWYSAHRIMARRCRTIAPDIADHYAHHAELIGQAFVKLFWNDYCGGLYDCVYHDQADPSIRPNQIFAVSLPDSPLSSDQQRKVLTLVTEKLLTPYGLRSLSPDDPRYRGRYGSSWESRDRAYHQGTVWGWLMGPYIEALLKVEGDTPFGLKRAEQLLEGFGKHLQQAGLGSVSEIFDGDAPHDPKGCFAQAWSVGEWLRAEMLVRQYSQNS